MGKPIAKGTVTSATMCDDSGQNSILVAVEDHPNDGPVRFTVDDADDLRRYPVGREVELHVRPVTKKRKATAA